jgi:hypothetical protein
MANGDPERFTIKEILTNFIQPTLEEIKEKLDTKADAAVVERLEARVDLLAKSAVELPTIFNKVRDIETKLTAPEKIAQMIEEGLRASKTRGWTIRERILGGLVGLATLLSLIVNLIANH